MTEELKIEIFTFKIIHFKIIGDNIMWETTKAYQLKTISQMKRQAFTKNDVVISRPDYVGVGTKLYRGPVGINPGVEDKGYNVYKCDILVKEIVRWSDGSYKGINIHAWIFVGNVLHHAEQHYKMMIDNNDYIVELS